MLQKESPCNEIIYAVCPYIPCAFIMCMYSSMCNLAPAKPIYKKAKNPPPAPIKAAVTPPMTTLDHLNGSGPLPAALFFDVVDVDVEAKPLAALRPVAVGLYVGVALPPAAVVPTLGTPEAVCVTAALFEAAVALGMGAPLLAKGTIFETVELKLVLASAILLFTKS
jgi:hypothetical protein